MRKERIRKEHSLTHFDVEREYSSLTLKRATRSVSATATSGAAKREVSAFNHLLTHTCILYEHFLSFRRILCVILDVRETTQFELLILHRKI